MPTYPKDGPSQVLLSRQVIEVVRRMPERNRNVLGMIAWVGFVVTYPLVFVAAKRRLLLPIGLVGLALSVPLGLALRSEWGLPGIAISTGLATLVIAAGLMWAVGARTLTIPYTEAAARRVARVLWNDPASGVMRHADAGYDEALDCARRCGLDLPGILG